MEMLRRLPLRYKIASVGTLVLLMMTIALGVFAVNVRALVSIQAEQDQAQIVTDLTGRLYGSIVDMQTGTRGYIISKDASFLEPYYAGKAAVPLYLTELQRLFSGRPQQQIRVTQLQEMINTYQDEVTESIVDLTERGQNASQLVRQGKVQVDQIKALLTDIQETQTDEANRLREEVAGATRRTGILTAVFAISAAAISLLLSFGVAASVTRPIRLLMEAADAVAKGSTGRTVELHSPDEVGQLGHSFNEMSLSLHAQLEENAAQQEELQAQQEELHAQNEELHAQQETLASTMDQLARDRAQLESLNQFARLMVAATDVSELTHALLNELMAAAGAQVGSIMLLGDHGDLRVSANAGLTPEALQASRARGFVAQAAATGSPVLVRYPDGALLRPIYHTSLPVEHELFVPIQVADRVLAVAALGRTGPAPWSDQEVGWVSIMAAQAGAALSNRLAYESLSVTHEQLQAVLGTTSEGFWLIDHEGRTLLVNNRFWEITGVEPNMSMTFEDFTRQARPRLKAVDPIKRLTEQLQANPDMIGTDMVEFAAPRESVIQRFSAPVTAADGRRIGRLFVLRDVTRETEVDRMKTEFISTVSHELRTPLTSIRGFVDLILDGDAGPITGEQREFLELVSRSTVRLANLINDLLDVEKIEAGRIEIRSEQVDLAPILQHVTKTFTVSAQEKGLSLDLQIDGPLPPLLGDADRLTQVFTNLVSNAVKYTKTGSVTVRAGVRGGRLVVDVIDTGIGLSKESLEHLFTRFFRVDNEYTREIGGAGLGLAITRAIVKHHRGDIDVHSEPGKGSTFTVFLPLGDALPLPPAPQEPATVPEGGRRVVLIIEDDRDIALLIAQHVSRLGLKTVVAGSGPEGLAMARSIKPDLITLDVMLPGMDGWEVISHLKRDPQTSRIPVMFLSILEETQKGFRLGADAFVTKPIDSRILSTTLQRLLDRGAVTALVATGSDASAEVRAALEQTGCQTVAAEHGRDLATQIHDSGADLLLIDQDWEATALQEQILALRRTPGFEHFPVVVLSGGRHASDPRIQVLGARTINGEIGPDAIALEIQQYLNEQP